MTSRQRMVYDFIREYFSRNGYPPSLRDIRDGTDIGTHHGVRCHLEALVKKGLIRRDLNRRRAIALIVDLPGLTDRPHAERAILLAACHRAGALLDIPTASSIKLACHLLSAAVVKVDHPPHSQGKST